jgi:hypothetical protein
MDLETHEAMSAALIERGIVTAEQVAADRVSLEAELANPGVGGFDPRAPADASKAAHATLVDNETDDGASISVDAFAGPASVNEYRFEHAPDAKHTDETMAAESAWRTALHTEGVPVSIASQVDRLLAAGMKNPPSAAQFEQGRQVGAAALAKLWGADRDANLAIANGELRRIAAHRPEIIPALAQSGVSNSAWLAATLYNMAKAKGRA